MIIWSGRGYLSVIVLLVSLLMTTAILPSKEQFGIALGAAFIIAAAFSWFMGRKWNSAEGKVLIDKETGQEVILKNKHTLFWIKIEYWGVVFGIFGVLAIVSG